MAKIFKSFTLARLENKLRYLNIKQSKLTDKLNDKNLRKLQKETCKANKFLAPLYQKTIPLSVSLAEENERKLCRYDLKQYWQHRRNNHKYMSALFAATAADKQLAPEVTEAFLTRIAQLQEDRQRFCQALELSLQQRLASAPQTSLQLEQAQQQYQSAKEDKYALLSQLADSLDEKKNQKLALSQVKTEQKLAQLKQRHAQLKVTDYQPLPQDVLLRVNNLSMYFGGLHAVEDLSFDVLKGEVFGLIGPNGAGKTTVFNCITQFYDCTAGEIFFENTSGVTVRLNDIAVHDVILEGISRTFQNVEVIKEMSVMENLLVAATRFYSANLFEQALHMPLLRIEEEEIRQRALNVLDFLGLTAYKDWLAFGLPYGILKKIEIARALMVNPKLIILDEPAAGLNDTETAELAKLIRRIRDQYNATILLVEHDMSLVMGICDRICAISFGKMLALGTPEEIQSNKQVQEAYLGTEEE